MGVPYKGQPHVVAASRHPYLHIPVTLSGADWFAVLLDGWSGDVPPEEVVRPPAPYGWDWLDPAEVLEE